MCSEFYCITCREVKDRTDNAKPVYYEAGRIELTFCAECFGRYLMDIERITNHFEKLTPGQFVELLNSGVDYDYNDPIGNLTLQVYLGHKSRRWGREFVNRQAPEQGYKVRLFSPRNTGV